MQEPDQLTCGRCQQIKLYSGDWYGDLCPECADETDRSWVCRHCGRSGNFEEIGGDGAENPSCCGSICNHLQNIPPP